MDISNLRAFVAVSRERGIGRAAQILDLTPSPVSRSIRQLEDAVGVYLFTRKYHAMDLTPAGQELLPKAVDILSRFDALIHADRAQLRMACTPWTARRFHQRLQELADAEGGFVLENENTPILLHKLAHGELDVVVVWGPVEIPGIASEVIALGTSILRSAEPFTTKKEVRLTDLRGHRVVMLPYYYIPSVESRRAQEFKAAGVDPPTILTFEDVMQIESRLHRTGEVLMTSASTDMPLADVLAQTSLQSVPLNPDDLTYSLVVAWRSADSRVQELLESARQTLRRGGSPDLI